MITEKEVDDASSETRSVRISAGGFFLAEIDAAGLDRVSDLDFGAVVKMILLTIRGGDSGNGDGGGMRVRDGSSLVLLGELLFSVLCFMHFSTFFGYD